MPSAQQTMREDVHPGASGEESDSSHASADAARLHAVARRIQLREHASRQQQLHLHKQLQQQQQLLQQQQQQLHQQDALMRHQEQLLRQQEQQLASRETEASLLLRQVSLLQQQLDERADRLAAAEGNYLDAAAVLQQLQQRVALGDEARSLVEEVRQQQQQDSQHLYSELRRLRRQLAQQTRPSFTVKGKDKGGEEERDGEAELSTDPSYSTNAGCESTTAAATASETQQQQEQTGGSPSLACSIVRETSDSAVGCWCCPGSNEALACSAWGCSAWCSCSSDGDHEAAVEALRVALNNCHCALESRGRGEPAGAAASAAVLAVREALERCPGAGADAEILVILLECLRAESMQIRVYAQQRRAAASAAAGSISSVCQQQQQHGGLAAVEEAMEREAYGVMGTALPQEVLLPLLAVQSISALLRLKHQSTLLANARWLQLLRDTVGSKFLEGSCCTSSSGDVLQHETAADASRQPRRAGDGAVETQLCCGVTSRHCRQHLLLQLLLRGSGGVAAAAGLLRQSTAPLVLFAAALTDDESGNNIFHLLCLRDLPQLFGTLSLTSLPCQFLYAPNREGKTPADLLPALLPAELVQLQELQKAAAKGELQQQAELQQQLSAVSWNLRAWRSVVFEYAAKASVLYRQHNNEAALCLYTEALKLQQRLLGKQQQLDEASGEVSASNLSLLENTAKLAFNKARSALRVGRWICSLQSCCLCLSLTPNYKAAYETAAEACEWLLDFEGALNYIQLMRQHCPEAFSAEHHQKRRLYEAQLQASSFQVLGVEKGSPKTAVNRAFRRMSILWHPDKASALSEDLRLRHENHFKRLNEARITLLDPESYAKQLQLPGQPLYRHPELLVVARPQQQPAPSPVHPQPAQLTAEQQQQEHQPQHGQQQQQEKQENQEETFESAPRLEKLQHQRLQLLRSIGSLQRQQQDLQRELEEQQGAGPQRTGTSHFLRWQELQKLQLQQQNKERRLAECEAEICQWLHRQEHEQRLQQAQQQQEQHVELQGDGEQRGCSDAERASSSSSPSNQGWGGSEQQQQQRQECSQTSERAAPQKGAAQPTGETERQSCLPRSDASGAAAEAAAASPFNKGTAAASNESASPASSGRSKILPTDATLSWASFNSSESDTEVPARCSGSSGLEATARNSSSGGFASAAAAMPTVSGNVQQGVQASGVPLAKAAKAGGTASPSAAAAGVDAGQTRGSPRVRPGAGRVGSRAWSAGPHGRTGEAAAAAAVASMATARRSLTTCIFLSDSRRAAGFNGTGDSEQPKRSAAYWEEPEGTSKSSTGSSGSGSSSSSSTGEEFAAGESCSDSPWAEDGEYGGQGFAAAATAAAAANLAAAAGPTLSGPTKRSTQQRRQLLPSPPPRRVSAAQGKRTDCSRSSSAGSSGSKLKGPSWRRRFVRKRGCMQQQQSGSEQQQQREQVQQQERRQQLWPGTVTWREATGAFTATPVTATTATALPAIAAERQAGATAAESSWLLPPDFPEPFAAGTPPEPRLAPENTTASQRHEQEQHTQHQQQQGGCPQGKNQVNRVRRQPGEYDWQEGPTVAVLSPRHTAHRMRQQHSHQVLEQQQVLHRKLHRHEGVQGAGESDARQLLFPYEELHYATSHGEAASVVAESKAETVDAATAADGPYAATPSKSSGAPCEGCATSERANRAPGDTGEPARSEAEHRWHLSPPCSVSPAEADSSNAGGRAMGELRFKPDSIPGTACAPKHANNVDFCKSNINSEVRHGQSHSDFISSSKSSHASRGNEARSRCDRMGRANSHSSERGSEGEDSALKAGRWRASPFNQQHQHNHDQHRRQEGLYRSAGRHPLPKATPLAANDVFLSDWNVGVPQRSSVPLLSSSKEDCSASPLLSRDGSAAPVATPTRLFPQYDPSHVHMQKGQQRRRSACPKSGPVGTEQEVGGFASANYGEGVTDSSRGARAKVSGGTASGAGLGVPAEIARPEADATSYLDPLQAFLPCGSLPAREELLLHSPSRTKRM